MSDLEFIKVLLGGLIAFRCTERDRNRAAGELGSAIAGQ